MPNLYMGNSGWTVMDKFNNTCDSCKFNGMDGVKCDSCYSPRNKWQPSELYTAYLEQKERADKAERWMAKLHRALNCPECKGTGRIEVDISAIMKDPRGIRHSVLRDCPTCAPIRKEAGDV